MYFVAVRSFQILHYPAFCTRSFCNTGYTTFNPLKELGNKDGYQKVKSLTGQMPNCDSHNYIAKCIDSVR